MRSIKYYINRGHGSLRNEKFYLDNWKVEMYVDLPTRKIKSRYLNIFLVINQQNLFELSKSDSLGLNEHLAIEA